MTDFSAFLSRLAICFVCSLASLCGADNIKEFMPITADMNLPTEIKLKGALFAWDLSIRFRTDEDVTFAVGNREKINSEDNAFVLRDDHGLVVTTSTLYELFPTKDRLYVIRDDREDVIGFLSVYNTSLLSFFKPIETTLYSREGEVLMNTVFSWSAFGLNPHIYSYKAYIPTENGGALAVSSYRGWLDNDRCFSVSLYPPFKMDSRLVLSMMLIHGEMNSTLKSIGSIDIDNLSTFAGAEKKLMYNVSAKNMLANSDSDEVLQAWLFLKGELEKHATLVTLDEEQMEAVIAELSAKFEHNGGVVLAEEIFTMLDSLSDEEKTVLIYMINSKTGR